MWKGSIFTVCRNGGEAWLYIALLLLSEILKNCCSIPLIYLRFPKELLSFLCKLSILVKGVLHEIQVVGDGNTVLYMCLFHIFDLNIVLSGLPE